MLRFSKWIVPALALGLLAVFSQTSVKADDGTTTAPSANGSITVNVVDSSNNPVANAKLRLYANTHQPAGQSAHQHHPVLASGVSDSNGSYTFDNLAIGDYQIRAALKGTGNGHDRASITSEQTHATVKITLQPPPASATGGNGGTGGNAPTTAPSN